MGSCLVTTKCVHSYRYGFWTFNVLPSQNLYHYSLGYSDLTLLIFNSYYYPRAFFSANPVKVKKYI